MVQQNKTTTYVDTSTENRAGETYQRPVHTDQYVYPQRPLPAYGQQAPQPVYQMRDVEGVAEMSPAEKAVMDQSKTQAQLNLEQAWADLEARERAAVEAEKQRIEKAAKDRKEFMDEFIGKITEEDLLMMGEDVRGRQKPARKMQ